ncbi:MAG TPA: hypothetical protein VF101_17950 [Gaiellaceae bacterium]
MRLLLVATVLLSAAVLALTPSTGATVGCGRISITPYGSNRQLAYAVRIAAGRVSCTTARRVMRTFMAKSVFPRGWFCVRGHASQGQKWAASCGTAAGADVKAYGPMRL